MLKKGEQFEAEVRDLSSGGDGVVEHKSGQIFFVPGVWLGEKVKVQVDVIKNTFGQARLLSVLEASPQRVEPQCDYHGFSPAKCGGCPWQFMAYEAQLSVKQNRVVSNMARLGVAEALVKPILAGENAFSYRNRTQLKTDGKSLGYVAAKSRQLVDVEECPILNTELQTKLKKLRELLPNQSWRPKKKHDWFTIDLDDEVEAHSVNQRLPFKQANTVVNSLMQAWVRDKFEAFDRSSTVLELFSGAGNFTQIISPLGFKQIYAVEVVDSAIKKLEDKKLESVVPITQDLFVEGAYKALLKRCGAVQVLLMDPPRDGLKNAEALLKQAKKLKDVVYISCDLATFVRDAKVFMAHGFQFTELQPIDLFPQTPHVEIMAHLQRRK